MNPHEQPTWPEAQAMTADEPDDVAVPAGIAPAEWDLKSAALVLAIVVAVFNVASFPVLRGTAGPGGGIMLVGLVLGVFPAQLGTLTLWLVFGSGPFLLRLAVHWGVVAGLFAAWALGCAAALADGPTRDVHMFLTAIACGLPLVSLAAQLPLWPLRTHLGWRVEHNIDPRATEDSLTIRDILVGTVVTAVAVAGVRIFPQIWGPEEQLSDYWLAWAIGAGAVALVSVVALVPALTMLLMIRDTTGATLAWLAYVASAGFVTVVAIGLIAQLGPPPEVIVGLICVFTSFALTLGLPLWMVRAQGWRLRTGNRSQKSGAGASSGSQATGDR
jgi:hypothetical protein